MKLKTFLYPKSIALIGASRHREKVGFQILNNLIINGYKGKIYPINLNEKIILGLKAYKSVTDLKKADLAVVAIPSQFVAEEIKKCARKGIKNIIIISAGFSEVNAEGKAREMEIQKLAVKHKLNILGPNCFGIINTENNLNATFAKPKNKKGDIAFITQSGAIASAVLDWVQDKNIGFSKFVSLGNEAGLDADDFFEFFIRDKESKIVAAYLEEINDGKKFMEVVSRLVKVKPVAILKSGKTKAGASAAMSHTGSLAGSYEAIRTGLRRVGAIELNDLEDMFDLFLFLEKANKIKNNEIALVSNAGGPLVATTDLIENSNLKFSQFSEKLKKKLKNILPPVATIKNPLDIIGDADAKRYELALENILKYDSASSVIVILTPQTSTEIEKTALIIAKLSKKYKNKNIYTSFIGGESLKKAKLVLEKAGVLDFEFPNKIISSLSRAVFAKNGRKLKIYKSLDAKSTEAENKQLDFLRSIKILKSYKIPFVRTVKIKNIDDLKKIKYPAVLKVTGKNLIHKTEEKAVDLNLGNRAAAEKAFHGFKKLLEEKENYCIAQPMVRGEIEMIAGFKRDKSFGPILMVGMGGIYTEVFKDVQTEIDDLNPEREEDMLEKLKIYPILKGARGRDGVNLEMLKKVLTNLARLARERGEIQELDINPLILGKDEVMATDIRMII